ncbi:MAG: DUF1289 domain-containing protein [Betaproteobacteria bacterium]|nr:DUF1289 domain-containing protein [Betaproteobacteria bacterium]
MNAVASLATPCIGVCTLDDSGRVCLGCCRTADEIAVWVVLDDGERTRIIGELPGRRRRLQGIAVPLEPRKCSGCGTPFGCGANDPQNPCWCAAYPVVEPDAGATCLCPACLAAAART